MIGLVCLLASPLLAWNTPDLRKWLLLAVTIQLVIIIGTITFFYPINKVLLEQAGAGLDAVTITAMARRWVLVDRVRYILRFAAFLSLLRATTLFGR